MNCMELNKGKGVPELGKPCWEEHQCGRETAGANSKEFGICMAYGMNLGEGCWLVHSTLCGGEKRKGYKEKADRCSTCSTFLQYDDEHKAFMLKEWIDFEDPKDKDKKSAPVVPPRSWRNRGIDPLREKLIATSKPGWWSEGE